MGPVLLQVVLSAALVAASSLAASRWGARIGGLASALPAIAGPFLLLVAQQHGDRVAATAANGTLAGLVMLSGFALAYTRTARRYGWLASLVVGWSVAAALAILVDVLAPGAPLAVLLAIGSLALAWRLMPCAVAPPQNNLSAAEALSSMAIAALLVFSLAQAVSVLGAQLGGALAGLPVIATVLAVNLHRRRGAVSSTSMMRGMLEGMAGFVAFCEVFAVLAVPAGGELAFLLAATIAVGVQASVICLRRPSRGVVPPLSFESV